MPNRPYQARAAAHDPAHHAHPHHGQRALRWAAVSLLLLLAAVAASHG